MKALLLSVLLVSSYSSFAVTNSSKVKCFFTEPFIATELDLQAYTLSVSEYGEEVSAEKLLLKYESDISIVAKTTNYVLTIDKTKKGSDGMSDVEYDYEGVLSTGTVNFLFGGCNKL